MNVRMLIFWGVDSTLLSFLRLLVCGAVDLYCIKVKWVYCTLIDINRLDEILLKTGWNKIALSKLNEGKIYCRLVLLDCISFSLPNTW